MVKLPILPCSHVWLLSSHSIAKATQNLQVVLFINCLAFWCVFKMHYAVGIEETGQHHFHIAANFSITSSFLLVDSLTEHASLSTNIQPFLKRKVILLFEFDLRPHLQKLAESFEFPQFDYFQDFSKT